MPHATTTFGSTIWSYISCTTLMFCSFTLPVTKKMSACLGLPVLMMPKRSTS